MSKLYQNPGIYVKVCDDKNKGYGVFTETQIKSGDLIEECHHIPWRPGKVINGITDNFMRHYRFGIMEIEDTGTYNRHTIALGYGSIYNSSNKPNVEWDYNESSNLMEFHALVDISPGDELCINYESTVDKNRTHNNNAI